MLSGWRLAAPAHAQSTEQMLSGEGAFLHGGRWNSKGVRVAYLGSSLAQAAMELLIHLGRSDVLRQFHKLEIRFEEGLLQHIALEELPENWAQASMAPAVQAVGDAWVADQESVFLQVPSVAVPGETNYLFNPAHPDAGAISIGRVELFSFDPRLLEG